MIYFRDTHPEAERVQIELLQKMSAARKLQLVGDLNRMAKSIALSGLRERHPRASAEDLELAFLRLMLGNALAERVHEYRRIRKNDSMGH